MKRPQFSLSGVLLITAIAAAFTEFSVRWVSVGAQSALEGILRCLWLGSLVLTYWKSTVDGWTRVIRVSAVVGAVWTAGICGTYSMFATQMRMQGEGIGNVLLRGVLVAVAGTVAAMLVAGLIQFANVFMHLWRIAPTRSRIVSIGLVAIGSLLGILLRYQAQGSTWQPNVVGVDAAPDAESAAVREIKSRHRTPDQVTDRRYALRDFQSSPDGRFISVVNGPNLVVFDAGTLQEVARFHPESHGMFVTTTFLSDSSGLMAVTYDENHQFDIVRWNTTEWKAHNDMQLRAEYLRKDPVEPFPILADQKLVLLYLYDDRGTTRVRIAIIDPLAKQFVPNLVAFLSLRKKIDKRGLFVGDDSWRVSSSGRCVVSPPFLSESGHRSVHRTGSNEPIELPSAGRVISFITGGEFLVVSEWSPGLVWKRPSLAGSDQPPFWDHWRPTADCRVVVIDCTTGRRVQQSDWWRCSPPYLSSSRTCIAAKYLESTLVWELR